ncbi:hypothetical protein M408DRAFT_292593 [Serendipita vermifera MAFF 305830]|uniref:Uncharacterized protein n=1 Tax=Serendipita vermifera MAFF 305830 TaxID=933852 RepID=A0A0C2WY02_SERVB|nr:hypothetical protein M408DRAFT_292593 [Serendipita vermifera MAFF 305830]
MSLVWTNEFMESVSLESTIMYALAPSSGPKRWVRMMSRCKGLALIRQGSSQYMWRETAPIITAYSQPSGSLIHPRSASRREA